MLRSKSRAFLLVALSVLLLVSSAYALSEEERKFLLLYFDEEDLVVVSATRSLKSIDRIAENVEVVTKDDIELMNAHTVADVLNTVTGVEVWFAGSGPGNLATASIQGSDNLRHVAVFMDGIPLNNISNNTADLGFIPVQFIEKIEIIKGPASSAWGSSLGGVVNIITRNATDKTGGTLSASYGERDTGDFRAEIRGKKERFGFYAAAGRLQTDGFRTNNDASDNYLYTKLSYDVTEKARLLFSLLYGDEERGNWADPDFGDQSRVKAKQLYSDLSLDIALSREAGLNISLWSYYKQEKYYYYPGDGSEINDGNNQDNKYGASVRYTWRHGDHSVVAGSDYDKGTLRSNIIEGGKQEIEKWAFYANDTIVLGKFSVTPGIRYDYTDTNGDFISPSLGVTYDIAKKTLIRVYVARGFSIPPFNFTFLKNIGGWTGNPDLEVEKVMSYQAGIETGALEYLWLKLSAFRHDISDALVAETAGPTTKYVNKDKLRRQGIEVELKTLPLYNTTFSAGATYMAAEDRQTGDDIPDVPTYSYKIGVQYDDKKSFRALLQGNYIWWNADKWHLAKYSSFIFDLNISKTVYQEKANSMELFLTGHNIFNGSQYWDFWYKNARRWIEGGLRYKF